MILSIIHIVITIIITFFYCYIYIYHYIYNVKFMDRVYIYAVLIFRWIQLFQPCPAAGTFEMAAKPLGTSANFKPADGDK
jgi:hypothetical protein